METTLIKVHTDFDYQLKPSQTQSFSVPNFINNQVKITDDPFQISDIEMITFQSVVYTSLKDLLPSSPPAGISPTSSRKDSWREIPIKDPLLQHAAWAYLQPMTTACDADDRNCFVKMKDRCGGLFECFGGIIINGVVVRTIKGWFNHGGRESEEEVDGIGSDKVD
ncbi:unnamed protein product [Ilex paraguariensis]|uniref:Uncharacterized protein n=1 Tax=Ilex paraguariensis TaxID=185542 RepID=A0ABC8QPD5_9AQUA